MFNSGVTRLQHCLIHSERQDYEKFMKDEFDVVIEFCGEDELVFHSSDKQNVINAVFYHYSPWRFF